MFAKAVKTVFYQLKNFNLLGSLKCGYFDFKFNDVIEWEYGLSKGRVVFSTGKSYQAFAETNASSEDNHRVPKLS